jgi:hypothetical protein
MPKEYNRKKEFIQTRKNILQYGRQGASFKRRYGTPTPWKSANPNVQKRWKTYSSKFGKTKRNKSGKRIHKKGPTTIKNFNFTKKKERKPKSRKTIAGLNVEQVVAVAKELQKEAIEKESKMENNASSLRRSTRTRKAPTNSIAEAKKIENARKAEFKKASIQKKKEQVAQIKEEKKLKEEEAKGPRYSKSHVTKQKTVKKAKSKATLNAKESIAPTPTLLSVIPESPIYPSNSNLNINLAERFRKIKIQN